MYEFQTPVEEGVMYFHTDNEGHVPTPHTCGVPGVRGYRSGQVKISVDGVGIYERSVPMESPIGLPSTP